MANTIDLELKESKETPHKGFGAGPGYVINEEYTCPCGKGKVFYEKDDIPGFKDSDTYSNCGECNDKYTFKRGYAVPK